MQVPKLLKVALLLCYLFPNVANFPSSEYPTKASNGNRKPPLFVAHRGAKFLIPEHTVPAFDLAMLLNIDYLETDLIMTKDGVLVSRHEIKLREDTDIAHHPEFASLLIQNRTLFIEGKNVCITNDWLVSDFTLPQLSTLRVSQKESDWTPQHFNGYFGIPTFQEFLDTVHKDTWRKMHQHNHKDFSIIGIMPELKYSQYYDQMFANKGPHHMEQVFLNVLKANGYFENKCQFNGIPIPCSPLIVQCFQVKTVEYLYKTAKNLTLMTLIDHENVVYLTYGGLKELVNFTSYIGVWKEFLYTGVEKELQYYNLTYDKAKIESLGGFVQPQNLVNYAHELGLKVAIYTIYHSEDNSMRGCAIKCETNTAKEQELNYYLDMGVDAMFVEGVSESLRMRDSWWFEKQSKTEKHATSKREPGKIWITAEVYFPNRKV